MARAKKKKPPSVVKRPKVTSNQPRVKPVTGSLVLILALLIIIALGDYRPEQLSRFQAPPSDQNLVGAFGTWTGFASTWLLGWVGWVVPVVCLWFSGMYFFRQSTKINFLKYLGVASLLVGAAVLTTLVEANWIVGDKSAQAQQAAAQGVGVEPVVTEVEGEEGEGTVSSAPSMLAPQKGAWTSNELPHGRGGIIGNLLYRNLFHDAVGMGGTGVIFGVGFLFGLCVMFYDNLGRGLLVGLKRLQEWNARETEKKRKLLEERAAKAREERETEVAAYSSGSTELASRPPVRSLRNPDEPAQPGTGAAAVRRRPPPRTAAARRPANAGQPLMGDPEPPIGEEMGAPMAPSPPPFKRPKRPPNVARSSAPPPTPMTEVEPPIEEMPSPPPPWKSSQAKSETPRLGLNLLGKKRKAGSKPPMPTPEQTASEPKRIGSQDEAEALMAPVPPAPTDAPATDTPPAETADEGKKLKIIQSEPLKKSASPIPVQKGGYIFPKLEFLTESSETNDESMETDHQGTAENLVRTLGEFGVKVTMGEVHTGPVITRYDVYPAAGVRVEKIANLEKNLALGLKAMSVRILAPVPGKGCVGIEVPNRKPQSVFLRDILESESWSNHKAEIPVVLGKEVSGKPLVADLTRMPHLLIAGSTGSGKTVCINAVITSLLYHASPEDVRFVMVDPKIVEMQVYNSLPHMMIPVVTDPKKVPAALKYLLNEMERRYQVFAKVGVRNIAGYNARLSKNAEEKARAAEIDKEMSPEERAAQHNLESPVDKVGEDVDTTEKLPYIVCVIDELADLMMVAPADIETGVARLAQLARAAGIHLIIATQRPSVNVITGVIKANLPSRIAFKVAAKVDSRTILDTMGADQLIGRGDMLFLPPGSAELVRAQGAFVSDDEITTIVNHLKQNGEPTYDENFQRTIEAGEEEGDDGGEPDDEADELIPDALEVIRQTRRASTSMLQRRLRIGYNRAARIMEILEDKGYVGPENGAQPREILRDLDA